MIPYFECPFMNLEYANSIIAVRRLSLSRKGRQTLEYKQARKRHMSSGNGLILTQIRLYLGQNTV